MGGRALSAAFFHPRAGSRHRGKPTRDARLRRHDQKSPHSAFPTSGHHRRFRPRAPRRFVCSGGIPRGSDRRVVLPDSTDTTELARRGPLGSSRSCCDVVCFLYAQLQSLGARKAADHGEIIIHAIRNYEAEVGELPSSLADLVPRELDSIPGTGMTGFPSFVDRDTRTETGESERLFASYELRVNLYKLLQFDCLVYWPEGNYPDSMYGGGVERIRAWAYVHE